MAGRMKGSTTVRATTGVNSLSAASGYFTCALGLALERCLSMSLTRKASSASRASSRTVYGRYCVDRHNVSNNPFVRCRSACRSAGTLSLRSGRMNPLTLNVQDARMFVGLEHLITVQMSRFDSGHASPAFFLINQPSVDLVKLMSVSPLLLHLY